LYIKADIVCDLPFHQCQALADAFPLPQPRVIKGPAKVEYYFIESDFAITRSILTPDLQSNVFSALQRSIAE